MKSLQIILLIFITSSCCFGDKSIQTGRYELSEEEIQLIPYAKDQQIKFVHSNGYEFFFTVTNNGVSWEEAYEYRAYCGDYNYASYQSRIARLHSEYPKIDINLYLSSEYKIYQHEESGIIPNLNIIVNQYSFYLPYNDKGGVTCNVVDEYNPLTCFDSIKINNKTYTDVIEAEQYHNNDNNNLCVQSILYNKQGIIQIKMSNNETFTIAN